MKWRFICPLLMAMTFVALNVLAQPSATYYVSAARGNDANAGNTAGLPFKTLTKALAVMRNDAAASVTILVEKGSYRPSSQGADIDATYRMFRDEKNQSGKSLRVLGGYNFITGTRDIANNVTILDGGRDQGLGVNHIVT